MSLCDDGHDEVCYEGRGCPVCFAKGQAQSEIEDLNNKIKELEQRVETLETKE